MKQRRTYYNRPTSSRRRSAARNRGKTGENGGPVDIHPELRDIFEDIGLPESSPFVPDPFQLEAVEQLKKTDVLVSAPTGSGKTWIATEAIKDYLAAGKSVWYASPLKALSNSKFEEFSELFGGENVGILTGDRKENSDAPVIVGTTEILRNQLYDAMYHGDEFPVDLAVIDECHYLADPDRGVVWEETLIYLPVSVRLLLLSATVRNTGEISRWLESLRHTTCRIVYSEERPVPLHLLFLFPSGEPVLFSSRDRMNPRIRKFASRYRSRRTGGINVQLDPGWILQQLRRWNLVPAIFFLKSRADCDRALERCPVEPAAPEERKALHDDLREILHTYPHLGTHRQLAHLVERRVVSHHAGQLPYWKVLLEKMMQKGRLDAIFSTSTVAAGVNFPARTVVLVQSDRYDGREFKELTATELHQMLGRAGRRGKDRVGFGLIAPGLYIDPHLIQELKDSPPDPIRSQIHINFSMVLNLLLSHDPEGIKELLESSMAAFQEKGTNPELEREWNELLHTVRGMMREGGCRWEDPAQMIDLSEKRRGLRKEIGLLTREIRRELRRNFFATNLKTGRVFADRSGDLYVCIRIFQRKGTPVCAAQRIKSPVRTFKKNIKWKKIALTKIRAVFDYRLEIARDIPPKRLETLLDSIPVDNLSPIERRDEEENLHSEELSAAKAALEELPCSRCEYLADCDREEIKGVKTIFGRMRQLGRELEKVRHRLWADFNRHLLFLKETDFVENDDRLTPDGLWASKLRVDQPLLIAECIRKGAFEHLTPGVLPALLAPFVLDRSREVKLDRAVFRRSGNIQKRFTAVLKTIDGLKRHQHRRGFDSPPLEAWPVYALYLWAGQCTWERLLEWVGVSEGDMASLILRTADHLRQIASLDESHPDLAGVAREAIPLILREPVLIL